MVKGPARTGPGDKVCSARCVAQVTTCVGTSLPGGRCSGRKVCPEYVPGLFSPSQCLESSLAGPLPLQSLSAWVSFLWAHVTEGAEPAW